MSYRYFTHRMQGADELEQPCFAGDATRQTTRWACAALMSLAAMQAQAALPTPTFTCNGAINSPGAIRASGIGTVLNTFMRDASGASVAFAEGNQSRWQYAVYPNVPSGVLARALGEMNHTVPNAVVAPAAQIDTWLSENLPPLTFQAYTNGLVGDVNHEKVKIGNYKSTSKPAGELFPNVQYQLTAFRYAFTLTDEAVAGGFSMNVVPFDVDDAVLAYYLNGKRVHPNTPLPPQGGNNAANAASGTTPITGAWVSGDNTLDVVMQNVDQPARAVKLQLTSSSTASCVYVIGGNPISSVDTNTPPIISGTSTMPPGMLLDVEIRDPAGNLLDTVSTTVQPDGSWTVTAPRPYPEGTGYSGTPVVKPTDPAASPADVPQGSPQPFDVTAAPPGNFTVGGTVTGLPPGSQLILTNGTDTLTVDANGSFTFPNSVPDDSSFTVLVGTQPNGAVCTVANGSGQIAGANATNVTVTCTSGNQPPGPGQATAVPTLSEWALILMSAVLAGLAAVGLRRRS